MFIGDENYHSQEYEKEISGGLRLVEKIRDKINLYGTYGDMLDNEHVVSIKEMQYFGFSEYDIVFKNPDDECLYKVRAFKRQENKYLMIHDWAKKVERVEKQVTVVTYEDVKEV